MPGAGLTKAGYVQAVLDAIAAAERENPAIRVRLILSVDRRNTAAETEEVVALTRRFASGGGGVVGIDLCGDPARGDVSLFTPAFRAAREAGLKITIHFAEAECSASEAELDTIMSWYPDRLGHVIHVPERVKRVIASRKTMGLELCLSCNVHAKMISGSFEAHHFGEWWKVDGVTVVPCVSTELDIGNSLGSL